MRLPFWGSKSKNRLRNTAHYSAHDIVDPIGPGLHVVQPCFLSGSGVSPHSFEFLQIEEDLLQTNLSQIAESLNFDAIKFPYYIGMAG